MTGVMAPAQSHPSRPLMLATRAPLHPPPSLMSVEVNAFAEFDPQVELRRFLWGAAFVLGLLLCLWHGASAR